MRALPLLLAACSGATDVLVPDPQQEVLVEAGDDVILQVGEEAVFDGRASTEGDAVWDFGDGTTAAGTLVRHTWSAPGNHVAVLTVTGSGGLTRSDSLRVTVHRALVDPPPLTSSPMILDAARDLIWLVEPDAGQLVRIDRGSHDVTRLDVCPTPRNVALDEELAVACEGRGRLVLVNPDTFTVRTEVLLDRGGRPFGVVGRNGVWWVADQGREELVRLAEGRLEAWPVDGDARALALTSDGVPWATRFRSHPSQGALLSAELGVISLALEPGPDSDTSSRGVPNLLNSIALSPDGDTAWVAGQTSNVERGLVRDGQPLTFETAVRATVRVVDLAGLEERFAERKQLDNQGQIHAIAVSPYGTWLYVAHGGTGTIQRLDAFTLDVSGSILGAGAGLDALALSPDGLTLYSHAALDRQVTAWDLTDPQLPTVAWTATTVDSEPLPAQVLAGKKLFHDASDRDLAKHGYLSCAACHPDGRDDGQVWDFTDRGEGLRNTITLEGRAGTAMGRLHWSGNFDEVQDFENDIRHGMGGLGLMTDADFAFTEATLGEPKAGLSVELDALAAYVTSLDTMPTSPWHPSMGGELLFFSKGCDTCHPADTAWTDSSLETPLRHDVGTLTEESGGRLGDALDGLDTPTLAGSWATGPWLHDGSASSLAAAIGAHDTVELTPQEIVALEAFVRGL